ncbi:MAG: S41 family peptidase [Clostridia bacterium]|nr:S41 family peptidase [Clostridia bacterium]
MNNGNLRKLALVWGALMIAVISSTATLLVSGRLSRAEDESKRWVSQAEYDTIQRYSRLDEVRQALVKDYYKEVDEDALVLGAIRGMTGSLNDPYTFYYTPEELQRENEDTEGVYFGIGTLLQNSEEGEIELIRVFPNSPAEAAGLHVGDVILAVDGEAVSGADGLSYLDAVRRMRGGAGSEVTLTVRRDGERMAIPVTRGEVKVSYASYQVLPGDIGYINISQFTGDASKVFHEAIDAFRARGISGLVIDVRNNPGGLLDQVVSIADTLLPKGLIVYTLQRDGSRQDYYSGADYYDVPLAVLVNDMSASASEILAGAVQALGRGTVVGVTTYGKGVVQSLQTFQADNAGMQLTTASYFDALDRCPQEVGVKPDVEVALEGTTLPLEPDPQSDNQLAEAIRLLGEGM